MQCQGMPDPAAHSLGRPVKPVERQGGFNIRVPRQPDITTTNPCRAGRCLPLCGMVPAVPFNKLSGDDVQADPQGIPATRVAPGGGDASVVSAAGEPCRSAMKRVDIVRKIAWTATAAAGVSVAACGGGGGST
ncbi:hypothetical protein BN2475_450034 [Paraburkholderia ribeironis]|uniref:Uncharacterized protein n=1 Tax=Paraburkholderia ribeironis TaxID=1247936 RepID=A0A1N7S9V3_9BURK|nr:hypothetical protein BN2475_450034 [Paraburkholderia ribeironis]